jgi:hypothetical protein
MGHERPGAPDKRHRRGQPRCEPPLRRVDRLKERIVTSLRVRQAARWVKTAAPSIGKLAATQIPERISWTKPTGQAFKILYDYRHGMGVVAYKAQKGLRANAPSCPQVAEPPVQDTRRTLDHDRRVKRDKQVNEAQHAAQPIRSRGPTRPDRRR